MSFTMDIKEEIGSLDYTILEVTISIQLIR